MAPLVASWEGIWEGRRIHARRDEGLAGFHRAGQSKSEFEFHFLWGRGLLRVPFIILLLYYLYVSFACTTGQGVRPDVHTHLSLQTKGVSGRTSVATGFVTQSDGTD